MSYILCIKICLAIHCFSSRQVFPFLKNEYSFNLKEYTEYREQHVYLYVAWTYKQFYSDLKTN